MKNLLSKYMKAIAATTKQGDAREESYYPALKDLFSDFPLERERKTKVTVLPKKTEAGNPDFRVWDGDHFIVGYIEAKPPGTNLDQVETSEQLERYLNTFPNLILTDFYEFRLYRNGMEIDRATIGRFFTARTLRTTPQLENIDAFETLASNFFAFKLPKAFSAENLAVELAKRTRFLRDQVVAVELKESKEGRCEIYGYYEAFQKYLIPSLTPDQFADLYSQTITYGLFAARTRAEGDFNRRIAFEHIPHTTGILRDVFRYISLGSLPEQMEVIVDDITAVLNAAEITSILDQYYKEGRGEDPIVHFYETFLSSYDPHTRERRGVYYTPEPVVKYIVKSVHHLLKSHFGLRDGLADPAVTVLDPAAGTLTFPAEAIRLAVEEFVEKYGEGGKREFIRNQVLKNFYALELMMAPYAIGHMKISYLLEALGYELQGDDSFQLYLTNTLEMEDIKQIDIPGVRSLSEESRMAGKVKREPILVIMGNPPYSGSSANRNEWTEKLLKEDLDGAQSYYTVDGKPLGERNPKWLQDDYVKFLRFAQWKIHKAGQGIVAMITNHAYLDNPTFRGMRQSLMQTFDEIYILDLHGNSLKKETSPDGSKDENVFDIRQGVSIVLLIKNVNKNNRKILHENLYGIREHKNVWLASHEISNVNYKEINPKQPFYFFVPRSTENIEYYLGWPTIKDIFSTFGVGMTTARDGFVIDYDKNKLLNRIRLLKHSGLDDDGLHEAFDIRKKKGWSIRKAWDQLQFIPDQEIENLIIPVTYRPFDERYIFYHDSLVWRTVKKVMQHMIEGENIALLMPKRVEFVGGWKNIFVTNKISEHVAVSLKTTDYHFPLYIYPQNEQINWIDKTRNSNMRREFLEKVQKRYNIALEAKNLFAYIYGILYSEIYREKYLTFLRMNFPKVPLTRDHNLFLTIETLGQRLIDIHLLESNELSDLSVKYQGLGNNYTITKPSYIEEEKRVYINKTHYFEGVKPEVWSYKVGGYQVMHKYLKDRKGCQMDDPRHYIHIATALQKTIEIQAEIDEIYPEVEKDVIEF